MRIHFIITLTILTVTAVCGQNFEGTITYKNTYKSKMPNLTDQQFTSMMGDTQVYVIKGSNYKSRFNGKYYFWQLYINEDNKLYSKTSNSETIYWHDGSVNTDSVIKVEVNKGVTEILGYKCDEAVLTCKSGVQKYYYNSKLGVDISLYAKHLFGNWYDYLKVAKALPIKSVIENQHFIFMSIATEIKETHIDDQEFKLPENTKTAKSPY